MLRTTCPPLIRTAVAMSALLLTGCVSGNGGYSGPTEPKATAPASSHRPPTPPTDIRVTKHTNETISLSWRDTSNNETGFVVERRTAGAPSKGGRPVQQIYEVVRAGNNLAKTGDVLRFTDTGLKRDTQYCYRVKAHNRNGQAWSEEVCGRTTNRDVRDHRTHSGYPAATEPVRDDGVRVRDHRTR